MIRYIIGAAALAGVFYGGYDYGRSGAETRLYELRAELAKQALENAQLASRYAAAAARADDAFESVARQHAAGTGAIRVQQPACPGGGKVPTAATDAREPEPAAGESGHRTADDAAGTFTGLTVTSERCEVIANRAVLDAAQVLHLQSWYEALRQARE